MIASLRGSTVGRQMLDALVQASRARAYSEGPAKNARRAAQRRRNKAIYLALDVLSDGTRDILGLWIEGTEGAKFKMKVATHATRSTRIASSTEVVVRSTPSISPISSSNASSRCVLDARSTAR